MKVRLFSLTSPQRVVITPAPAATLRVCRECRRSERHTPFEINARGKLLDVEHSNWSETAEVAGNYLLSANGTTVKLSDPLTVQARHGRLLIVLRMPLEDYVEAVLAGESGGFRSAEGLKAMAVVARTYGMYSRGRHQKEGFDVCDTTHCQDLRLLAPNQRLASAAGATGGELLWYEGRLAAAHYHAHCGGQTEAVESLWPKTVAPYLKRRSDQFCTSRSPAAWHTEIPINDLQIALTSEGLFGGLIEKVEIGSRTPSGRVHTVELGGSGQRRTLTAEQFRHAVGRSLGWNQIRSDHYEVQHRDERLIFRGQGYGHGVGLCQAGADAMGVEGRDYRDILAFYYPATRLGINARGFRWQALHHGTVELLSTDPQQDRPVLATVERTLEFLRARLQWQSDVRAQLRVFPTVEAFRNATGQPGWVAASTKGHIIRLQPLHSLGTAQNRERILRHELLHVIVEQRASRPLPTWFREGVVLWLEGRPQSHIAKDLTEADLDRGLRFPNSRSEMSAAYAIAYRRVSELVRDHGEQNVLTWLERGLPEKILASTNQADRQ